MDGCLFLFNDGRAFAFLVLRSCFFSLLGGQALLPFERRVSDLDRVLLQRVDLECIALHEWRVEHLRKSNYALSGCAYSMCEFAYRVKAFCASVVADNARGMNMRGCLRSYSCDQSSKYTITRVNDEARYLEQ